MNKAILPGILTAEGRTRAEGMQGHSTREAAFREISLPRWLKKGTRTTTLFIETLVLYLHHHFLLHHHLLAVPAFL